METGGKRKIGRKLRKLKEIDRKRMRRKNKNGGKSKKIKEEKSGKKNVTDRKGKI